MRLKVILTIFIIVIIFGAVAYADDFKEPVKFMIVLDDSGSMKRSDPDRLAIDGAELFVDLLPTGQSDVGIVLYGSRSTTVQESTHVDSYDVRRRIKRSLERSVSYSQSATDYVEALEMAVNNLMELNAKEAAILLFTDGVLDVGEKDMDEVQSKLNDVISYCAEMDWPIYTIGLNYDGSVDSDNLGEISEGTNAGKSLIAQSPQDLSEYFSEIIKRYYRNVQPRETAEVKEGEAIYTIDIPEMVLETNILMNLPDSDAQIELIDPQGEPVEIDNELYQEYSGKNYDIIKLVEPKSGQWTLEISGLGADNDTISVQSLNFVDFTAVLESSGTDLYVGNSIDFESYFVCKGIKVLDSNYYRQNQAELYITKIGTDEVITDKMTFSGDVLSKKIVFDDIGEYKIKANLITPYCERESNEITIIVENNIPEVIKKIPNAAMGLNEEVQYDLSEFFDDADNNIVCYKAEASKEDIVNISIDGSILTLSSVDKSGEVSVNAAAADEFDALGEQIFNIKVYNEKPVADCAIDSKVLMKGRGMDVNLNSFFSDPEGLPLEIDVRLESENGCISSDISGGTLHLLALEAGVASITLTATDSAGDSEQITGKMKVLPVVKYLWYKFWFVPLILIIFLVYLYIRVNKIRGIFKVQIKVGEKRLETYDVDLRNACSQESKLYRNVFTLKSIIDIYAPMVKWFDGEDLYDLFSEWEINSVIFSSNYPSKKVKVKSVSDLYLECSIKGEHKKSRLCRLQSGESMVLKKENDRLLAVKLTYIR